MATSDSGTDAFPSTVVVAVDGHEDSSLARTAAADLSRRSGAGVHVVHVWNLPPVPYGAVGLGMGPEGHTIIPFNAVRDPAMALLDREADLIAGAGGHVAGRHLIESGNPADPILEVAEKVDASLLVVGSRGRGVLARLMLGSVSEEVVHRSTRPVLVLRGGSLAWPPKQVVIGDDSSEDAHSAGELAVRMAALLDVPTVMVSVVPAPAAEIDPTMPDALRGDLRKRASHLQPLGDRMPNVRLAFGEPAEALLDVAEEDGPSLVVVGAHGAGRRGPLHFGSVSTKVLRASHAPVLILPSQCDLSASDKPEGRGVGALAG